MNRKIIGLTIGLLPHPASADTFQTYAVMTGIAQAVDGDDISFGNVHVRLRGIAAPEHRRGAMEPGGSEATANLARLVNGRMTVCHLDGTRTPGSGRPVAICFIDTNDVGRLQVRSGHARDCPAYSGRMYSADEASAQAEGNDFSESYPLPEYCNE